MSDPITAPAPAAPVVTTQTAALVSEVGGDVSLVKAALAAYKSGGVKALAAALSADVPEAERLYQQVQAALPEIKAGYKTTEFWLTVGVLSANGIYAAVTGHALPLDTNVVLVALTSLYTVVRSIVKKP